MPAHERLVHLADLAARQAPEDRARLIGELAELLLDWPEDYPLAMRAPFDALLAKLAPEADAPARADLARRFAALPDAPVILLNELFFDAAPEVKAQILRRNALALETPPQPAADHNGHEAALVAAARDRRHDDLAAEFARALGVGPPMAERILSEATGDALAAACKGAHLKRATFSALALLFAPQSAESEARLKAYDAVPQDAAENLVRFWRAHPGDTQAA
jgi:hypothetical protein